MLVLSYLILPKSAEEDQDYDLFRDKTLAQRAQQAGEDEEEGSSIRRTRELTVSTLGAVLQQ